MTKELLIPALAICATACCSAPEVQEKPNIVVFLVDDLGWTSLGYQNPKFESPNIDKLKEESLYFSRTYVPTACSSPSRSTIMTGKQALRMGTIRHIYPTTGEDQKMEFQRIESDPGQMNSRAWLPLEEITYAERLKEMGYHNTFMGKWHMGHGEYGPLAQGYDERYADIDHLTEGLNKEEKDKVLFDDVHLTDSITRAATAFIDNYDRDQPFLLSICYHAVHTPHKGRTDWVEKYRKEGRSELHANFDAMVAVMDISVGEILASIEDKGIRDNTIIIFTSDQGGFIDNKPLRGLKSDGDTLAEGGSRVPMFIYYPGMKTMGMSYDKPVTTADIYPTILEMASGVKCTDKQINGQSLMPALEGGETADQTIYLFRSYEDQNAAILEDEWKLITYRSGKIQLYDLSRDMGESTDLSQSEPAKRDYLLGKLNAWIEEATPDYAYTDFPGNTYNIYNKKKKAEVMAKRKSGK